jgi:hypothetical protein
MEADMADDQLEQNTNSEGLPTYGGDVIGPGTGGSPTAAGTGEAGADVDPIDDAEVAALVDNLREDDDGFEVPISEAAENVGTGTDR